MKKLVFLLVIVFLVAAVSLTGCGQKKNTVTGEDLPDLLPDLLEQEVFIENVYRGGGLPTTPNAPYVPDENGQCFVEVTDPDYPTLQALKEATEQVFTAEYAQANFYADFLDGPYARYKEVDGKLCEDVGQGGGLDRQWDSTSCQVLEETEEKIVATVEYLNYGSVRTAEITFLKTEGGLRIDAMAG